MSHHQDSPIGIFDSGIGGLTVTRAIIRELPQESFIYVADSARAPYGSKSDKQILSYSDQITRFLINRGVKLIVIACNTATAAAIEHLRQKYPDTLFVGTEPAIKPGSIQSDSRVIGLLATQSTLESQRLHSLKKQFAASTRIIADPGTGLVELIETGQTTHPKTLKKLHHILQPMIDQGIDQLILGCTHYPLLIRQIRRILGPDINIIDPNRAIARQVHKLLQKKGLLANTAAAYTFYTSGKPDSLDRHLRQILQLDTTSQSIEFT